MTISNDTLLHVKRFYLISFFTLLKILHRQSCVLYLLVLREQEKNWPCYECNRRFVSSEQLQQHLNMHDDKLDLMQRFKHFSFMVCWSSCRIDSIEFVFSSFFCRPKTRRRGRGRKRFSTGRRPGRRPKFIRLETPAETADKSQV